MTEIGNDLLLEFKLKGSRVSETEGDPRCLSGRVFRMKYLQDGGQNSGGSGVAEAAGWIK